jgi:serine/threonine-protein kinase RsbT
MLRRSEVERLPVADEVELMQAVMEVGRLARQAGLGEVDAAKVMTAVSELARNILKYAGRGAILAARLEGPAVSGIEVVAEDGGAGIADLDAALRDHFSTSGTLGLGLPGVRRMMDEFEIASVPGRGTRVTIRKWRS